MEEAVRRQGSLRMTVLLDLTVRLSLAWFLSRPLDQYLESGCDLVT